MGRGVFCGLVAFIVSASHALCADAAPPAKAPLSSPPPKSFAEKWDLEYGGSFTSDFNYRGFSISNRHASGTLYVRPVYDGLYVGLQATTLDLPFETPVALDFYTGYRRAIG